MSKIFNLLIKALPLFLLLLIILLAVFVRLSTLSAPTILDYDPFWYYRHAIEIMQNGMKPLKWDKLSYYPPGRPFDPTLGWEYTMILFYKIAQIISKNVDFLLIAKLSPVILAALGAIPAFLFGKMLSNNWGGLATALFAVLTPTFIGVSMAGYCDNDPVVVFYTFFSIYSVFLALTKKSLPYYAFAILVNLLFAFNWGGGWFVLLLFAAFLPVLFIFRILESFIQNRSFKLNLKEIFQKIKPLLIPLVIILVVTNILGVLTNLGTMLMSLLVSLGFIRKEAGLLVNVSVAELQLLNVFSKDGFLTVTSRIGLLPTLLTFFGLPAIIIYKLWKKMEISYVEIFLFLWVGITFWMILHGIRFALEFSSAAAVAAGYVIGNLTKYFRKDVISATVFGVLALFILMFVSDAIQIGYASAGMEISQNWIDALEWLKKNADKDSLITTWWDPGHIITGYTGLKVHADGAHCGPAECIPYNHNIRIQDMGRVFSTSNETEAINILRKYIKLTPEQCAEAKKAWPQMPEDACKPVSEMYVIASSDLIGKYYWLSFFSSCEKKFGWQAYETCSKSVKWFLENGEGKNFFTLPFSNFDQTGNPVYAGIVTLGQVNNTLVGVYQNRYIIRRIIYFQGGKMIAKEYNVENSIDGLLWVDPGFGLVIFMEPEVYKSLFTNMFFFNGQGLGEFGIPKLKNFELKYTNSEVKIFKVTF
jgi:dolichyl-diphosphooligosaccharide--protein glycosyltransferase